MLNAGRETHLAEMSCCFHRMAVDSSCLRRLLLHPWSSKPPTPSQNAATYFIKKYTPLTNPEISTLFKGLNPSSVSQMIMGIESGEENPARRGIQEQQP